MYFINLLLQFYSRKIFLVCLGTEILGLNTTVYNLLQFLNLAEMGIGAAIGFTLFKPLYDNDRDSINEILTLQGWFYRRVAYFVIGGSCILMCFFPMIFAKMELPLWYAYASYAVILLSELLSYFFNYNQVLLVADQQDYKIQTGYKLVMLIKIGVQTIAVKFASHPYIWWLVLEGLFAIIGTISLQTIIRKTYPYLAKAKDSIAVLRKKHSNLMVKIKQVFYHKIGGFVLTQTSPLIIYAFANLTLVTIYGNYLIIVNALASLMGSVFNSIGGGVGNLVASGDKPRIQKVFYELFAIRYLLVSTLCVAFYVLTPTMVSLWIGNQYVLSNTTVVIIILNMFIRINRATVDNFIGAYGLYGDIYAPLAEAILNIGCSVLLGVYYGLNGILFGVFISQFLVIFCWKPYYLYLRGIKAEFSGYLADLGKNMGASVVAAGIVYLLFRSAVFPATPDFFVIFKYLMVVLTYMLFCGICQIIFRTKLINFFGRVSKYIKR